MTRKMTNDEVPNDERGFPSSLGTSSFVISCPVPQSRYDHILLGHGSGGQLTNDLIRRLFVPGFGNEVLSALEDQATLAVSRDAEALRSGAPVSYTI
jgi:hypothetical protein